MVSSAAMKEQSLHILPRKRKQYSSSKPSDPFIGRFTRSKSQIHLHKNSSGRAWTDTQSLKNIHHPDLLLNSPLQKPRRVQCPNLENGSLSNLSIKDLRARARRVFSPTGKVVDGENDDCAVGFDFGDEKCNGSSKMSEKCENFEEVLKGSDLNLGSGSGFGFCGDDKEEEESIDPRAKHLDPGIGIHGPSDKEESKITPPLEEKKVESGNECSENQRNQSFSSAKMVLNSRPQRKVFKTPSSFSYRRMLPFLMDMAKDDSCSSRIQTTDGDNSCRVQKSMKDSNLSSVLTGTYSAKNENIVRHSDDIKKLDKGDIEKMQSQLHVSGQDSQDLIKKLPQTEEHLHLHVEGTNHDNDIIGGDKMIEEYVQKTPPDATILSELDICDTGANKETNILKTENQILGNPSNDGTCSNHVSIPKKSHRSPRRNCTMSTTKLIFNPCSRSKIVRTSSSFSYRRLLPFLMDVAKSSANIDQFPSIQKNLDSNQHSVLLASSDKDVPFNKNEAYKYQEKQEAKDHEANFPNTVKVHSVDGSSDDICPNLSTPCFSSSSSDGKPDSAPSDNISQPVMPNCLQMERASLYTHFQLIKPRELEVILPAADSRASDVEADSSAGTSCSTIDHASVPRESQLEVLENEPVDIGKNCIPQGMGNQKGNANKIKCVPVDQNSLKMGALYHKGTDNSTKGILKRNPRGCRGLCNCLNCASFRLQAERAFEFSRNQMLDAEEVALGLIDNLAEIRDLLEKFSVDASDLGDIQIHELQIREVCKKALDTEQHAKERLLQMKDDLNVHCRIKPMQQPTVTFSRHIEEKFAPGTGLSNIS